MENLQIPLLFVPTLILLSRSITFVSSISQLQTAPNQCLDDQRSILVELQCGLYHSQNFTFFSKAELWDVNTDCCSWKGVMCDGLGHVIGLDLNYKNLSGSFQSIFNLHHLQKLNLAGNNFNSSLFSSRFDRLSNLTHLNLSASCFHGQVPLGISYLTRLVSLDLSSQDLCHWGNDQSSDPYYYYYHYYYGYYYFKFHFDKHYYRSIGYPILKLEEQNLETIIKNMPSLTELYLDSVNISTQNNTWCETISLALRKLQVLSLSNCGLTGPFCSSLSRLQFLSKLNLDDNPISYLPPNFLEISSRFFSLSLVNCNLSGHFPTKVFLSPKMKSIDLSNNDQLMGQLPKFPLNSNLEVLSLSFTNFSGKLPESIGNLTLLTHLSLCFSGFSGPIPSSLANLTNLVTLDLGYNHFSGIIPPFHRSGVPNLSYLGLYYNRLSGRVHSSIFTLPSLQILNLMGNQLVGEIDEFANASTSLMECVGLSGNNLTGSIPLSIIHLPRLEAFYIGYNSFHSIELDVIFQIKNLRYLHLSDLSWSIRSDNNKSLISPQLKGLWLRSCNLTEFPEFIKTQERLAFLDLSQNQFHGSVPNWFWKKSLLTLDLSYNHLSYLDQFLPNQSLTYSEGSSPRPICNLSQLRDFNTSYNNLSGPLPDCLGNISTLYSLDLQGNNFIGSLPNFEAANLWMLRVSKNRLEGKLPRSLANCNNLMVLDVGENMMNDTFPFWLGKLPELEVLVLRENKFSGQIKHLFEHENIFSTLDVLDIACNDFSGEPSLDFLQTTQLRSLKIGGNRLGGKLPRSLVNYTKLEVLDLRNNMFHDTFPYWLENLPSLKVLVLRANRFYGTIKISRSFENVFPMLHILDIASNNFSGELPIQFFQCLRAMMQISDKSNAKPNYIGDQQFYQDSVIIVNKGFEVFYQKILTIFTCLDVSNNSFHGVIPEEISYLKSLKMLNFSYNSFVGPIPLGLGNLIELESLDLSMNNLSGKIPLQLTSLTFLAALDLSYNQLEGSIPQSNQFNTFTNDSYRGNPRLCGPPLTKKCDEVGVFPLMPPPREDVDSWADGLSVWRIALIGYCSGLVIGLCVGYTVLNELGNKWLDRFKRKGKRTQIRSW